MKKQILSTLVLVSFVQMHSAAADQTINAERGGEKGRMPAPSEPPPGRSNPPSDPGRSMPPGRVEQPAPRPPERPPERRPEPPRPPEHRPEPPRPPERRPEPPRPPEHRPEPPRPPGRRPEPPRPPEHRPEPPRPPERRPEPPRPPERRPPPRPPEHREPRWPDERPAPQPDYYTRRILIENVSRRTGGEWLRVRFSSPANVMLIAASISSGALRLHESYAVTLSGVRLPLNSLSSTQIYVQGQTTAPSFVGQLIVALDVRAESIGQEADLIVQITSLEPLPMIIGTHSGY